MFWLKANFIGCTPKEMAAIQMHIVGVAPDKPVISDFIYV